MAEVNKVVYGDETLIDLTADTVTPGDMIEGVTAHAADGSTIVGTLIVHEVIDNLESESADDALSAKQGKLLNDRITTVEDDYLSKINGGTVEAKTTVHSKKGTDLFRVMRDTWENNIIARVNGGHLVVGDSGQTSYCALGSIRKCASDNNRINAAAFYCNGDGTAIFTHKGGNMGVSGVNNDAWMKFNQNGFQVSYSGEYNKSATEAYTLLDSHNIGDDNTIKALVARIEALEAKA